MTHIFLFRLALDLITTGLLLAGLAYYWLDNFAHELIGTGMFMLIIVHNVFNRRWYGTISNARREARGLINIAIILSLLAAMLALLVTSLMISQSVFSFLPLSDGYSVRQIHALAAYWALLFVSIHLGMRWSMVMTAVRSAFGIANRSTMRIIVLRIAVGAIAAYGIHSSIVLGIGSKLVALVTMDFWDFNESTFGFFIHQASVVGLYVSLCHYATKLIQSRKRKKKAGAAYPVAVDYHLRQAELSADP